MKISDTTLNTILQSGFPMTPQNKRRLIARLEWRSYEQIAESEWLTRQAIHIGLVKLIETYNKRKATLKKLKNASK